MLEGHIIFQCGCSILGGSARLSFKKFVPFVDAITSEANNAALKRRLESAGRATPAVQSIAVADGASTSRARERGRIH
jgi:hypothetical protein